MSAFTRGDHVEITRGALGGRRGKVTAVTRNLTTGGHVVHVHVQVPILLTLPDGETRPAVLPYDPSELDVVAEVDA